MIDSDAPDANPDAEIGARVRRAREARGMSQADLSAALTQRKLSLPPQTIYKIEHGSRRLLASELMKVADALHVPVMKLLGSDEDRTPLLLAGARLEETARQLEHHAGAYARAMFSFAQAVDAAEYLHPNDEEYASGALLRQTPGWIATGSPFLSLKASISAAKIEVRGHYAEAVMDALRTEYSRFHSDG